MNAAQRKAYVVAIARLKQASANAAIARRSLASIDRPSDAQAVKTALGALDTVCAQLERDLQREP